MIFFVFGVYLRNLVIYFSDDNGIFQRVKIALPQSAKKSAGKFYPHFFNDHYGI